MFENSTGSKPGFLQCVNVQRHSLHENIGLNPGKRHSANPSYELLTPGRQVLGCNVPISMAQGAGIEYCSGLEPVP